ncbi:MAG: hypothetical protein LEGION0398_MBIBDBAK_00297 [Legionellaceae bacterium]
MSCRKLAITVWLIETDLNTILLTLLKIDSLANLLYYEKSKKEVGDFHENGEMVKFLVDNQKPGIKEKLENTNEQENFEKHFDNLKIIEVNERLDKDIMSEIKILKNIQDYKDANENSLLQGFIKVRNDLKHKYPLEHRKENETRYDNLVAYFTNNKDYLKRELENIKNNLDDEEIFISQKSGIKTQEEFNSTKKEDSKIISDIDDSITTY